MKSEQPEFFLIIPPGFERVAANEMRFYFPEVEITEQTRGGIGFRGDFNRCMELNQVLKVPSRILVRLDDFGCSDFPKLFKKVKNFPWAEWLPENSKVQVEASTHQSRLKIKNRIEKTVLEALQKNGFQPSDLESAFRIYVRINEDVCFLSLDTSGEILHKRGYREYTPEAPIRENLAAAILLTAKESFDETFAAKNISLIDPMAGSGTFLIEGKNLFQKNDRAYAFESFTNYIATNQKWQTKEWVEAAIGIESDERAMAAATKAFTNTNSKIQFEKMDLFTNPTQSAAKKFSELQLKKNKILVCNPPYGKRLKIEEPFSVYYPKILNRFEELFEPQVASVILPQKVNLERLKIPAQWKTSRTDHFSNGGFSVVLVTFKRVSD